MDLRQAALAPPDSRWVDSATYSEVAFVTGRATNLMAAVLASLWEIVLKSPDQPTAKSVPAVVPEQTHG